MGGELIGLVAVIMTLGVIPAGMYAFYRVRKLRTEERLAAIARGVAVPLEPELSQAARSRRYGLILVTGALGYITTFVLVSMAEPDARVAAAFGAIPLAIGIGYFIDATLVRREAHS
jgi:O-antigen ligase